ncbi:MAG: acyltransferase family protein [Pseudorhodoplanes sp.]|nr:acyltransferase family protein [Pseudorhodoplanes sp.]
MQDQDRIGWIDNARGITIILVVMMHSTLGVEAVLGREGFMHYAVAFATPFRIPAFFLISGLLLARTIDRPWRAYLDGKVVHFVYFYVLWLTIQFAFKFPAFAAERGMAGAAGLYLESLVQPFGTLWFIYLLPVFFVVTRLVRGLPPALVWAVAAALEIAPIETGSVVIDEFASRFVFFYSGHVLASHAFRWSAFVRARPAVASGVLALWAILNAVLVQAGVAAMPFVSLALGGAGAAAVIAVATLIAGRRAAAGLAAIGCQSLAIYLAFFLPMAAARVALVKSGFIHDAGTIALLTTIVAIAGALAIQRLVRGTRFDVLFVRPAFFRLRSGYKLAAQR